jgi:3',5'-nucleoside bisphosphate phosphatase
MFLLGLLSMVGTYVGNKQDLSCFGSRDCEKIYMDLHMHTRYSDGIFNEPETNVRLNAFNGIKVMGNSDHDNYRGYYAAAEEGKRLGVVVVPESEITTPKYHLLSINFDIEDVSMTDFLDYSRGLQEEKCELRVERLKRYGMPIDMETVRKYNPEARLGKFNIFVSALLEGDTRRFIESDTPGMGWYNRFQHYLGREGVVGELPDFGVSEEEAIEMVHKAGGKIGLAHPPKDIKNIAELDRLVELGVDFLEVQPNMRGKFKDGINYDFIVEYAKRKGLPISYGSDYHGPTFERETLKAGGENVLTEYLEEMLSDGYVNVSEELRGVCC